MGAQGSSIKEIFSNYTSSTALNGVPHIPISQCWPQLIYWIAACLVGLGMLIFHTTFIIQEYLAFDTITSVSSINNRTLHFPQVTFCSGNPVDAYKEGEDGFKDIEILKSLILGQEKVDSNQYDTIDPADENALYQEYTYEETASIEESPTADETGTDNTGSLTDESGQTDAGGTINEDTTGGNTDEDKIGGNTDEDTGGNAGEDTGGTNGEDTIGGTRKKRSTTDEAGTDQGGTGTDDEAGGGDPDGGGGSDTAGEGGGGTDADNGGGDLVGDTGVEDGAGDTTTGEEGAATDDEAGGEDQGGDDGGGGGGGEAGQVGSATDDDTGGADQGGNEDAGGDTDGGGGDDAVGQGNATDDAGQEDVTADDGNAGGDPDGGGGDIADSQGGSGTDDGNGGGDQGGDIGGDTDGGGGDDAVGQEDATADGGGDPDGGGGDPDSGGGTAGQGGSATDEDTGGGDQGIDDPVGQGGAATDGDNTGGDQVTDEGTGVGGGDNVGGQDDTTTNHDNGGGDQGSADEDGGGDAATGEEGAATDNGNGGGDQGGDNDDGGGGGGGDDNTGGQDGSATDDAAGQDDTATDDDTGGGGTDVTGGGDTDGEGGSVTDQENAPTADGDQDGDTTSETTATDEEGTYYEDHYTGESNTGEIVKHVFKLSSLVDFSDLGKILRFQRRHIKRLGWDLKDLLVDCSWDARKDCKNANYFRTVSRKYGYCYTWNSPFITKNDSFEVVKGLEGKISKQFGASYGLRMTFDIHRDKYLSVLAPSYGIRVALSRYGTFPLTTADGINVPPGIVTSVVVKLRELERLPTPYRSHCISQYPEHLVKYLSLKTEPYSMRTCLGACRDRHVSDLCKCTANLNLNLTELDGVKRCKIFDDFYRPDIKGLDKINKTKISNCLSYVTRMMAASPDNPTRMSCDECYPECSGKQIQHTTFQTMWPTESYVTTMRTRKNWKQLAAKRNSKFIEYEWAKKNLARLHIYFADSSYEVIEEHKAKTEVELIAEWGGIAGLYLGLSLLSFFEIGELIYMLIAFLLCPTKGCGRIPGAPKADDLYRRPSHFPPKPAPAPAVPEPVTCETNEKNA